MEKLESSLPRVEQEVDERLFNSFRFGLEQISDIEKKFACRALGIDPLKLQNISANFNLKQLEVTSANMRELLYGDLSQRFDSLVHQALVSRMSEQPQKYEAFTDPDLLGSALELAKAGLLFELTSHRVDTARSQRHQSGNLHHRHRGHKANRAVIEASRVDELITFNHVVRDFIDKNMQSKMPLDRTQIRTLLRTILLGDSARANEVERGVSLEVATKHLIEEIVGPGNVSYGGDEQDKRGGDLIIFPTTTRRYVDVKSTPPHEIRWQLDKDEISLPGYRLKHNGKAYLWLGTDLEITEDLKPPYPYQESTLELMSQIAA